MNRTVEKLAENSAKKRTVQRTYEAPKPIGLVFRALSKVRFV